MKILVTELAEVKGTTEIKFDPDRKGTIYAGWNYFDSGIRNWLLNGKTKPTVQFTLRKVNTNRTKVLQVYYITWDYERPS